MHYPLFLRKTGKLEQQPLVAANGCPINPARLFVSDKTTIDRHWLRRLRVPVQADPKLQGSSQLRPLRSEWIYHRYVWLDSHQR